jgi:hypothetical protein
MFYDSRQNRYFDISGPNPTPAEAGFIERQYSAYVAAQAEQERFWQEESQRQQSEAERQAALRRQTEERDAAMAQIAEMEFHKRQRTALGKIVLASSNIECTYGPATCGVYKVTVGIRNQSEETISALSFGWAFIPRESQLNCPTTAPTHHRSVVRLAPGDSTVLNIDGYDGPGSNQFRVCIVVTDAEIVRTDAARARSGAPLPLLSR